MCTAVALTASSIRTIQKEKMLQMLRKKNKTSNSLVAYLLSSVQRYKDHVSELLTSSAEQRLVRVLLRLAHLEKKGPGVVEIPLVSHQVLADMVGTTRPRVNLFMNRFRQLGWHKLRWRTGSPPIVAGKPCGARLEVVLQIVSLKKIREAPHP